MRLIKDIPELVEADVISQATADKIQDYYRNKGGQSTNRLFIVFGILGAILIGLGIILIISQNWNELSRTAKTLFAFLPLLIGQFICGFVLIKKQDSIVWRESGTAFLFFAVGAVISLVGQIYNISGDFESYLLTWMLLCLPLIYVMNSSITSIFYIVGITIYAIETGYSSYTSFESYSYWILLLAALPHYYLLYRKKPKSNFMVFHNWIIPLSLVITLGTITNKTGELTYIAYFSLFGLFYSLGNLNFFSEQKPINSGSKILGTLGTIVLLLVLSPDWFWKDLRKKEFLFSEVITTPEFIVAAILSLLAGTLFYLQQKNKTIKDINLISSVFILFILIFIIGLYSPLAAILINILVFAIGLLTIRDGAKQDNLGLLNFGLLIITALVIFRFFDTDLSFVIRGILFVSIGVGFFITNYWMLKKRKTNEQQ